jgi:hypothetical protein
MKGDYSLSKIEFYGRMKQECFGFWNFFNSIARFVVLMFFHVFHGWILILKLYMSRSE